MMRYKHRKLWMILKHTLVVVSVLAVQYILSFPVLQWRGSGKVCPRTEVWHSAEVSSSPYTPACHIQQYDKQSDSEGYWVSKLQNYFSAVMWVWNVLAYNNMYIFDRQEFGLERFVPVSLMSTMKRKELRKLISHFLKLNRSLSPTGQKSLTSLQAKLYYLNIISELPSYGAKCFSTNIRVCLPVYFQI
jgi:hypothetical protein